MGKLEFCYIIVTENLKRTSGFLVLCSQYRNFPFFFVGLVSEKLSACVLDDALRTVTE